MSATKVSRWRPRVEWCALWLEEQGPDGPGALSWGQYVGVVLDRQWRWGRDHVYNGPHDQFSVGPVLVLEPGLVRRLLGRGEVVSATPHRVHGLSTCDACGKDVRCVARLGEQWACPEHFPPMPCEKCGEEAKPVGVERFMIVAANGAAYALGQNVGYFCAARHLTHSEPHMGPGWDGWREQG